MEYSDDKPSEIITQETSEIITQETCKCNLIYYYCFCDGENALLDKLKVIGVCNLKIRSIVDCAITNGHLNVLKWLQSHTSRYFDQNKPMFAIQSGQLDVLKWLHSHTLCYLDEFMCECAALYGYLKILKWLVNNNAPFEPTYYEINIHCLKYLFTINKTYYIKHNKNLQQIERLKILASGVF